MLKQPKKVITMKKLINTLITSTLIIVSMSAHAEVKTTAQALTLCKAQAEKAHPGYKRSTAKKIKQMRKKFKIDLHVLTETGKIKTQCLVTKDGEVTYVKKDK